MNIELTRAAWRNHQHGNAQFLKPGPRTAREAFGCDLPHHRHPTDGAVFWMVMACFLIGLAVVL